MPFGKSRSYIIGPATISAPATAGTALTVNGLSLGSSIATFSNGNGTFAIQANGSQVYAGNTTASGVNAFLASGGSQFGAINSNGGWQIGPPNSGPGFGITAAANAEGLNILGSATSGQSLGIECNAGTTSADFCALFTNQADTTTFLNITGAGDLIGRGVAFCLRATSIETRTSTTTLTNSTQLTYAIPAAGTYEFEVCAFTYFTTAVTDGFTGNINYSGTFTAVGSYLYGFLMNGTTTALGIQPVEVSATVNNALAGLTLATYGATVAAATPAVHRLKGNLIATGTGTLAFAFAQSTLGVDTTNLGVGSYMKVTQLS